MDSDKRLKRRFSLTIFVTSCANILILFIWIILYASPLIPKIANIRDKLVNEEIKIDYNSMEELKADIENLSKEYNVTFILEDKNNQKIINTNSKQIDLLLLSKIISVDNIDYLMKVYPNSKLSITGMFIRLFIFELLVMTIIFGIIFLFSKNTLFNPIEKIINDIRNYKLGRKPIRNKLNNELDLIQNEFVNLTEELDEEKKEQNRIIASISHDIKTPLTSIIGYSNLIKDEKIKKEEIKAYNEKIYDKAIHIKEILGGFDDYLVNENNSTFHKTIIGVDDLVINLNKDYKVDLDNANISFNINNQTNKKYVEIDILKIKRIFSNILSNSIRYLNDNGIIDIKITLENDFIKFRISDNGPGVPENIIDKIFEPLFTTDNSRKISGLGLSICREFVELHGGVIRAYNNNGLTIEFTIPEYKENKNS